MRDTFFTLSECLSNVLISGEYNFDEKNGQEMLNWSEVLSLTNNFLNNPYFDVKKIGSFLQNFVAFSE